MIWDDRLAEVWAEPGKAGAGVVIGAAAVLTTRHVVAGALARGRIRVRVVRPGVQTADWVPVTVRAEDADWDVALLGVSDDNAGAGDPGPRWLTPSPPSPVFVRLGTSAEPGCEAVGFPQAEVQHVDESPVTAVRQSEHAVGTLLPGGQAKPPVNPERPLPKRWIPFDVAGPVPGAQAEWGGMSGAAVVLPDGRLAGLVVSAEAGHQQRRLYVVPFADVLEGSAGIAGALAGVVGGPVVIEARDAPQYRDVLQGGCLAPDGFPVRVREAGYKAFGVTLAGVPGEPDFLDYVPRDADQKLRDGLHAAQTGQRMLLVVGGSAGGKSRSATEAARLRLPDHRLLCPRRTSLGPLLALPAARHGPALVWLDDVERYRGRAFKDTVERLLQSGHVVVATIRRSELEARKPKGDLHNPFGEALTDTELVVEVDWPVLWNDQERQRVAEHVRYPALLAWVAAGQSPSAWVVAGSLLVDRLRDAEKDDERPARYALARTVLDWYHTGIAQPIPLAAATSLLQAYLPDEAEPAEIEDALQWGLESVTGASRRTKQALLTKIPPSGALSVHDYIQDADARASPRTVQDAVWRAALDAAASEEARFAIGLAAAEQGNTAIASKSWLPLARRNIPDAMFNLGVLLHDSAPARARRWYERAAHAGDTSAMNNLGVLLKDTDPDQARDWWQRAAQAGDPDAMNNLGALLEEDTDLDEARQWYERAAQTGHSPAMNNLGALLEEDTDLDDARQWYERAAQAGYPPAMNNLGALLKNTDPDQARDWWQRAAQAGDADAMNNLGALLEHTDRDRARQWYERAAQAGHGGAIFNLWLLLRETDPDQARVWYERALQAHRRHVLPASLAGSAPPRAHIGRVSGRRGTSRPDA
jgi:TPR repeat protein